MDTTLLPRNGNCRMVSPSLNPALPTIQSNTREESPLFRLHKHDRQPCLYRQDRSSDKGASAIVIVDGHILICAGATLLGKAHFLAFRTCVDKGNGSDRASKFQIAAAHRDYVAHCSQACNTVKHLRQSVMLIVPDNSLTHCHNMHGFGMLGFTWTCVRGTSSAGNFPSNHIHVTAVDWRRLQTPLCSAKKLVLVGRVPCQSRRSTPLIRLLRELRVVSYQDALHTGVASRSRSMLSFVCYGFARLRSSLSQANIVTWPWPRTTRSYLRLSTEINNHDSHNHILRLVTLPAVQHIRSQPWRHRSTSSPGFGTG